MTDINRLIASLKRRSAHVKEFGDDVTFVKLEDLDALVATIEKSREASGCPAGVDLQDWVKQLAAESLQWQMSIPPRVVAGIKADGVEEFIDRLQQHVDEGDFVGDEAALIIGAIDCGKEFCEQLREGADK
ncbi:hypothetical protein ACG9G8_000169 [Klebsiella aerogenes]